MANARDFLLPDLGEGLTEGEIVSWLVAVGDTVEVDQPVAEVETAKAVVEVPSPFAGIVTKLFAEAGEEVEVGAPLLTIDVGDAAGGSEQPTPATEERGTAPDEAEVSDMVPDPAGAADGDGGSGNVLVGYGTGGGGRRRRRGQGGAAGPAGASPVAAAPPTGPGPTREGRPLAKPPVRKLAKDLGVDLAAVAGSGPDGVVTRDDIQAHSASSAADAGNGQQAVRAEPLVPPAEDYLQLLQPGAEEPEVAVAAPQAPSADLVERRPLKGMRKAIARQMTISRREIPEATSWVDVDATGLWELRADLNASQERVNVSALAIIMRAVVAGLREFPEVNSRLDTETNEIVLQRFVNLGFAAQTDAGLMVPVIHGADRRSMLGIAEELARLAAAARDRSITPAELTGSTFSLSNYGSFGVDGGNPVINHPEAAILGVGRITDRPWVHAGRVEVRKVMQLSIAFDHRICDGRQAAGFLRLVGDCIESPTTLLGAL